MKRTKYLYHCLIDTSDKSYNFHVYAFSECHAIQIVIRELHEHFDYLLCDILIDTFQCYLLSNFIK